MSFLLTGNRFVCCRCTQRLSRKGADAITRPQSRLTSTKGSDGGRKLKKENVSETEKSASTQEPEIKKLCQASVGGAGLGEVKNDQDEPKLTRLARRVRRLRLEKIARQELRKGGGPSFRRVIESRPGLIKYIAPVPIESNTPSRDSEHFNWYWETLPPTLEQSIRANKFFLNNRNPRLVSSAARFMQVPDSDVPEVAFVGRSNVGKSSLLNAIVDANVKDLLARTSSTPGFTKTMNFYGIGPGFGVNVGKSSNGQQKIVGQGGLVIVDMPGYGEGSLREWGVEIMKYIQSRKQLRRVFVLLDTEHGIKEKDRSLLASLRLAGVSHQAIMSKMDKLYIPEAKEIKGSKKGVSYKEKGTVQGLREKMMKIKDDINPPVGGGALGEILACSSEVLVDGRKLGIDHVRYAILKAVGLEGKKKKKKKAAALESE